MDMKAFPFKEQQSVLAKLANCVLATAEFTSGTTTNETTGFEDCRVGTLLITTVSSTTTVFIITAVSDTGVLTGKQISNAA